MKNICVLNHLQDNIKKDESDIYSRFSKKQILNHTKSN